MLRNGVGLAVKGVRAGVGGTVRLVWPIKNQARRRKRRCTAFADHWTSTVTKFSFDSELCESNAADHCQSLMTVGSRHWGNWWDGRGILNVKLYEFAVYADQNQMRRSSLGRVARTQGESLMSNRKFYHQLRSTKEVDMSLVVKASRSLPLSVMSSEYEKILKRRLTRVGGSTDDPSLAGFLSIFDSERLPTHFRDSRNNVKKGSTICFKRCRDGTLSAFADDQKVGTVKSQALCSALFDLYLGDEPVSLDARTLAANRVLSMVSDHEDTQPAMALATTPVTQGGKRSTRSPRV